VKHSSVIWGGLGLAVAITGLLAWRIAVSPPMSAQSIFQKASPGMILIETFDDEGHKMALGSGFVVSASGTAVTNYHVIRGAARAVAKFADGTRGEANGVVAFDPDHDVAAIRLAAPPRTALRLSESDELQVGQNIVAIGSPLGFQNTVSEGIISGLRNGVIQMTDPISPGSSGGAVLDVRGRVVGISVATAVQGQNLNFAVPIKWVRPYLESQNLQSFKDLTAENTVTNDVMDGSLTISPRQSKHWPLLVNPNTMSNPEIEGKISSAGGSDGKITLEILLQGQHEPIYSCRSTSCEIHQRIRAGGTYLLVLDNRESPIFGRTVSGTLSIKYVK
jgi:S1-C subfamily serine protease